MKAFSVTLSRAVTVTCDDITFIDASGENIHLTTLLRYSAVEDRQKVESCSALCKRVGKLENQPDSERDLYNECFLHPWLCGESPGEDEIQWQRVSGIKADYIGGQQGKCLKGSLTEIVKQGGDTNQEEARSTGSPPKKQAVRRSSQKEQASGQKERASGWLSKLTR